MSPFKSRYSYGGNQCLGLAVPRLLKVIEVGYASLLLPAQPLLTDTQLAQ